MPYFIRVDAMNDAVHKLVAEPVQEPRAEEQQEVAVEPAPEDLVNPADLQDKPRSISHNFQYINVYLSICAFTFYEL